MRRCLMLAALTAALCGCSADNILGGSVGDLFPLNISRVDVLRNDDALQVTYYSNRGTFLDVVVRIAVSLNGIDVKRGVTIPLQGEGSPGHQRTSVAHAPGGEPVRVFPNVKRGDLRLAEIGIGLPDGGGTASRGDFSMVFANEGGDIGQGRTLTGNFATGRTIDAGYGPLP